jgi:hypothetical protein
MNSQTSVANPGGEGSRLHATQSQSPRLQESRRPFAFRDDGFGLRRWPSWLCVCFSAEGANESSPARSEASAGNSTNQDKSRQGRLSTRPGNSLEAFSPYAKSERMPNEAVECKSELYVIPDRAGLTLNCYNHGLEGHMKIEIRSCPT